MAELESIVVGQVWLNLKNRDCVPDQTDLAPTAERMTENFLLEFNDSYNFAKMVSIKAPTKCCGLIN